MMHGFARHLDFLLHTSCTWVSLPLLGVFMGRESENNSHLYFKQL